jgi:hypothetical protein
VASLEKPGRATQVAAGEWPSERSGLGEPDALKAETGVLGDQVVVPVVVQDSPAGEMGAGGDHQVRRRQPVVSNRSELVLRVQGGAFDRSVDGQARQLLKAMQQPSMVGCRPSRVARLEQEGQADGETLLVEPLGDLLAPLLRNLPTEQA